MGLKLPKIRNPLSNVGAAVESAVRNIGPDINREFNNAIRNPLQTYSDIAMGNAGLGAAAPTARQIGMNLVNPPVAKPPEPGQDPRLTALQTTAEQDAKKFRQDLEGFKQRQFTGLLPSFQIAGEEGVRRTRENVARRGLLYSGLAKKAEGSVRGELATQIAGARSSIAKEAEQIADAKDRAAAAMGLDMMNQLMGQAEQYYNISFENNLARRRAIGQIAAGVGYGAGALLGNKDNTNVSSLSFGDYNSSNFAQPTEYGGLLGVKYGG